MVEEEPADSEAPEPALAQGQEDRIPDPNEIDVVSGREGLLHVHGDEDLHHHWPLPNETFVSLEPGRHLEETWTSTRSRRLV